MLPYWEGKTPNVAKRAIRKLKRVLNILNFQPQKNNLVILPGYYFNESISKAKAEGKFENGIALLRLDGDTYYSYIPIFLLLFDLVLKGSIVLVDDYMDWEGCREAIKEFRRIRRIESPLVAIYHNLDAGEIPRGVWWRK